MKFKRSITTTSLLFSAIGGIVGSGWLFGPFFAAKAAGPAAIFAWLLGGGLMMVIALTFAELASAFPMAGGTFRYLHLSHGPLASYTIGWIGWISMAAVAPVETMALLAYAANYIPGLMHKINNVNVLTAQGILVAAFLMLIMCTINTLGLRLFTKTMNAIVVFKLLVPVLTVIFLLSTDFHASHFFSQQFAPTGIKGVLAALSTCGVIFSFIGYTPAIELAAETKTPQRSIPIAIIGALLMSIFLYTLLQIALIAALPDSSFANGWQNLSFPNDSGPFAGIMLALGLVIFVKILFVDAAISPFGTALIYTGSSARSAYAFGTNGYLPEAFLKLNRFGIPGRMILLNFLIGMILFLPFPTWQGMVGFLVSALVFVYAVGPLSLLIFRENFPDHPRPFRTPAAKFFCPLAFYICNLIIYWTGWATNSKMLIAITLGYIILASHYLFNKDKSTLPNSLGIKKSGWIIIYLVGLGICSYLGSFDGGHGILPFGWDFIAIGAWSMLTFILAQRSAEFTSKDIMIPKEEARI